ncbi:GNAT family N-acetyltransferase [Brevibacterium sp. ZH18]|uniref:GNAT family N-acetyltransferase n=1 Tax=Brevibacterium sp. ZH18 TaxID=2927784 RepID=UPI001F623831|nr:GNAT family N-acetyltransferase [Brevibacterium sp. ZH18]MCI4010173.1 GNAT family N-acetyltransferase [Brevibacterium sp. ZH18]
MSTSALTAPRVAELPAIGAVLDRWQSDAGPLHLHTGDLGWYSLKGAEATAQALRIWRCGDTIRAIGLLDGEDLLRLSVDPDFSHDDSLSQQIESDIDSSNGLVFGTGPAIVEARGATRLCDRLKARGWSADEPWTPLKRDLSLPVEEPGIRVEAAEPDAAETWTAIHWSAFRGVPYTADDRQRFVSRWNEMMSGPFSSRAQSLLGYDSTGVPVAVTTVWSAGPNRPGLIEPLAVHRDHQGHGYGKAMAIAAARSLQQLGSSLASVCAESSNKGAVAAYSSAGYAPRTQVRDLRRDS